MNRPKNAFPLNTILLYFVSFIFVGWPCYPSIQEEDISLPFVFFIIRLESIGYF